MGSELIDADGRLVWGLTPRLLVRQLLYGDLLERLRVRPGDGIRARDLVRTPGLIPGLGSLDPYTPLLRALRETILVHPSALMPYAYDWRQSIASVAGSLAKAAEAHLRAWQTHRHGSREARLWLVCHSLGGLVARYFTEVLGGRAITREIVTFGTPHFGSLKALAALADGNITRRGLLANDVRDLARTMPSMYELVPRYACVASGRDAPRRLTPSDIAALGADWGMMQAADGSNSMLDAATLAGRGSCPVRARVGVTQPTFQTVSIDGGEATMLESIQNENRGGDGTVYRDAASLAGETADYVPQRHGRLASTPEAIAYVHAVLTERPQGPPMAGAVGIGMEVQPAVAAGERLRVRIIAQPEFRVHCYAFDQSTGRGVDSAIAAYDPERDEMSAELTIPRQGMYAIEAKSGGYSAIGETILAHGPPEPH